MSRQRLVGEIWATNPSLLVGNGAQLREPLELRNARFTSPTLSTPTERPAPCTFSSAFYTSKVSFRADEHDKIRRPNLRLHPHWPSLERSRSVLIDNGLKCLRRRRSARVAETFCEEPAVSATIPSADSRTRNTFVSANGCSELIVRHSENPRAVEGLVLGSPRESIGHSVHLPPVNICRRSTTTWPFPLPSRPPTQAYTRLDMSSVEVPRHAMPRRRTLPLATTGNAPTPNYQTNPIPNSDTAFRHRRPAQRHAFQPNFGTHRIACRLLRLIY